MSEGLLLEEAVSFISLFASRGWSVALAESCTGGLAAALLTEVPGSSSVVWGGVVAYSNECKTGLLGVGRETIEQYGAVSSQTARALSTGMLRLSGADFAIGITGIAGPTGGSAEKPVGLVWFSWAKNGGPSHEESIVFVGDRSAVRRAAAEHALRRGMAWAVAFPVPGIAGEKA
ncbi:MAG: nicotinamide-nucleotide amidohydrolase family protein [Treponema sp.]|nr:nicotinamide-nucleotide amidohydrolase family protein [Treponema sp.]